MKLEIKPTKTLIEIEPYEFARALSDEQVLEMVRAICEETMTPIDKIRDIVNSEMFDA